MCDQCSLGRSAYDDQKDWAAGNLPSAASVELSQDDPATLTFLVTSLLLVS